MALFNFLKKKNTSAAINPSLSDGEVFFLEYCDGKKEDLSAFSQSFFYNYNLDYRKTVDKLFSLDYLGYAPIDIALNSYKVSELKRFLQTYSMPTSGSKATLVERILDTVSLGELPSFFPCKVYAMTPSGANIVNSRKQKIIDERLSLFHDLCAVVRRKDSLAAYKLLNNTSLSPQTVHENFNARVIERRIKTVHEYLRSQKKTSDKDWDIAVYAMFMLYRMNDLPEDLERLGYSLTQSEYTRERLTLETMDTLNDFRQCNILKYQISTCRDKKVCPACRTQHGKIYYVKDAKIGVNAPPFCDNCRCVMIAVSSKNIDNTPVQWERFFK